MQISFTKNDLVIIFFSGALAALINLFRLPLFFEAEFVFGGILVLLVAVFRGPWAGLLTCLIGTIPLVVAWGSFWAMLTFGLEALFVGFLFAYTRINVILIVIIYWLFIGMPISWYSISQYEFFLDAHRTSILIKQLTNGILYAHLAAILMYLPWVKKLLKPKDHEIPVSINEQSSHVISSLLITMGVIFFFQNLHQKVDNTNEKLYLNHQGYHNNLFYELEGFLEVKMNAMNEFKFALSEAWEDEDKRQSLLLEFNQRHPEYMTMIITDKVGRLIHSSPAEFVENMNAKNEVVSVADRDYYIHAIDSQAVYLSPGFFGRGFGTNQIAAISVGVPNFNIPSENIGVVEGTFALTYVNKIREIVNEITPDLSAVVVDQNNQVISFSDELGFTLFQKFELEMINDDKYKHSMAKIVSENPAISGDSYYFKTTEFDQGWQVITLQNESQFAQVIEQTLINFSVAILVLVLVAKLLAFIISRSWTYSLYKLNRMIENDHEFNSHGHALDRMNDLPIEIKNLYQEIKQKRRAVLDMNQELQQAVAERTEKLQIANTQLNELASKDALTQLNNRHVFNQLIQKLWSECHNNLTPMSMVLIDVDHFKKINDSYGHPVGDDVLFQMARKLEAFKHQNIRCLARIGGEEFCLLMSACDHDEVTKLAEEIRQSIQQSVFKIGQEKTTNITVSIGVATIDTTQFTQTKLYQLADDALYEAKKSGRNQVKSYFRVT